jgi:dipeptidyl aminopeptidase/acylaminoacyl peptidase
MAPQRLGLGLVALLASLAWAVPVQASFPGRNGAIAYVSNGSGGGPGPITDIRSIEVAARGGRGEPRTLIKCTLTDGVPSGANCTEDTFYSSPSFSPDGRRIAFDTGDRLAVIDVDGSDFTLVPAATANDGDPAFSPDGRRIAFTGANDRGGTDVYIRRLGGGPARKLVLDASAPTWSARGRLAYVREGNVYSADPNGRKRRFITSGLSPDWSPDGRRLLVVRPDPRLTFAGSTGRIYIVEANGHVVRRVGTNNSLSNPVWSPDGRWLAFDGFDFGVHRRRLTVHARIKEIAPTQYGDEDAFVASFSATWQPRQRP